MPVLAAGDALVITSTFARHPGVPFLPFFLSRKGQRATVRAAVPFFTISSIAPRQEAAGRGGGRMGGPRPTSRRAAQLAAWRGSDGAPLSRSCLGSLAGGLRLRHRATLWSLGSSSPCIRVPYHVRSWSGVLLFLGRVAADALPKPGRRRLPRVRSPGLVLPGSSTAGVHFLLLVTFCTA